MIYVFYNNDPVAADLGGGAEHFRGLHRALAASGLEYRLVGARLQNGPAPAHIEYISTGSSFWRFYLALWWWFLRHRSTFRAHDVFHFHRNYAAWPKLLLAPQRGAVLVSYHNVSGRVLEHWFGHLSAPLRALMLRLERRVAALVDAIICVSRRDRRELAETIAREPFGAAKVIPAALDDHLFAGVHAAPPPPCHAHRLLFLGRLSHQKNVPLAIEVLEALVRRDPRYTLTIAGRGEDAKDLMRRIAASPAAAHIDWVGAVPHDDVPDLLSAHGTLLLTSRYEASPTVVKEALRAMRPVVSTDVGDVADWLDEDASGFICASTPAALADGVARATALITEQRYRHTDRLARLSETRIMGEVVDLYRSLSAQWASA